MASLPRHQRRGLIEADYPCKAPRDFLPLPRHQRRGLIEAWARRERPASGSIFRAIKGAVSLKRFGLVGQCPALSLFRAIKGAVSLKHGGASPSVFVLVCLPRHQRRGLIEALEERLRAVGRAALPRHQRRGLIEAFQCNRRGHSWFSLPRHQRRGLIEASLLVMQRRYLPSLPRHQRRGLIEAALAISMPAPNHPSSAPSKARSH